MSGLSATRYSALRGALFEFAGDVGEDLLGFTHHHVVRFERTTSGSLLAHGPPMKVRVPSALRAAADIASASARCACMALTITRSAQRRSSSRDFLEGVIEQAKRPRGRDKARRR